MIKTLGELLRLANDQNNERMKQWRKTNGKQISAKPDQKGKDNA